MSSAEAATSDASRPRFALDTEYEPPPVDSRFEMRVAARARGLSSSISCRRPAGRTRTRSLATSVRLGTSMICTGESANSQAAPRRICWAEATAPPAKRTMSHSVSATTAAVRAVVPRIVTPPGVWSADSAAGTTDPTTW